MIPLRDDVPRRSAPVAVVALVAANVATFLYEVALVVGDGPDGAAITGFIDAWGLVPREFLRGAAEPTATQQLVWLTPFTAMFLHGGLLHLTGNLLYLWIFGTSVEEVLGHARFLALYAVCGLAAAAAEVASVPGSFAPVVGASGAVSGVLGAYLVSYPGRRLRLLWPGMRVPVVVFLLVWIALQVVSGLDAWGDEAAGVAWWAHVGGVAAGLAHGRAKWVRNPTRSRRRI